MKKRTIVVTVSALLLASQLPVISALPLVSAFNNTAFAATASASTIQATLSSGSSSAEVASLQQQLGTLGYFTYPSNTGYYGPLTVQAVSSYQEAYGLPVTGAADSATRTSISHAIVKKQLLAAANEYLGTPYDWGGTSPSTGFDCSGFVYYMFTKLGVPADRLSSGELFQQGTPVDRADLMPGDLVFFSTNTPGKVNHVGFYIGNGKFISSTRSAGIAVQPIDSGYWGPRYLGAKQVY
ncbi:C40 family peptidase [Paenibacillus sp. y28]